MPRRDGQHIQSAKLDLQPQGLRLENIGENVVVDLDTFLRSVWANIEPVFANRRTANSNHVKTYQGSAFSEKPETKLLITG